MTTALAAAEQAIKWTPAQVETIKATVAKGADDNELKMFLHLSQTYGLDPFAKEIWFIKMGGAPTIMTSRDGYLKIANNRPDFEGLVADVVYEGDEYRKTPDGADHRYGVNKRGGIVGAYALVYRKGMRFPTYVFAPFRDYNKNNGQWKQFPHAMILKVAESMALKRAFSLYGLVSREELDHGNVPPEESSKGQPETASSNTLEAPPSRGDRGLQSRKVDIYSGYLQVCGHPEHAKNAIFKITDGRGSKDWTELDICNLESDLKRRREEAAAILQPQEPTPVPQEAPSREQWVDNFPIPVSARDAVPGIDLDERGAEIAAEKGIGPDPDAAKEAAEGF
jgi:phage recombination protein Bet